MTFEGVHEVRSLRPGGVAVAYFDSFDLATAAVEREADYRAVYFTLNPIDPAKVPALNPPTLKPSANTAADADVSRRVRLMLDFDPIRPASCSATDSEKATAVDQAEAARRFLASRGWPSPMVADSGNGIHLLYRIDLANDAASTALVRGILNGLKERFPLLDSGNFNASRICKIYGSWSRKGPHTDDRPHRRSAILEGGDDATVTAEQLQALAPVKPKALIAKPHDIKLAGLTGFLQHYGVVARSEPRAVSGGWQIEVQCPWVDTHSTESRRDSVVSFVAGIGYGYRCFHSHCADKGWREFRAEVETRNPGIMPFFGKLPPMTHADVAKDFVATHDDFVSLYDVESATGVWLPGTRWRLSDPRDTNLRLAIRQHLEELFDRYPKPEGRDSRQKLKDAAFVNGVLSEVRPMLPPKSVNDFDADPVLLPLPDGQIADLSTGVIREMTREDCQSRRLKVSPTPTPTPRFDRFLREITCEDDELAAYILRLMAIAISGQSQHTLIFFYGSGRNGKGALLRLLSNILGGGSFVADVRPRELADRPGDESKRLFGKLRGVRLAFTAETVGTDLDLTTLKLLSGGDSLSGAKLYQDDSSFRPSHTLVLTTNDRPVLPATAAFKGRIRFVPFKANFSGREDLRLDAALAAEIPGILWRLIEIAPSTFDGDKPPAVVMDATEDLIEENDVAKPFIDECLVDDPSSVTRVADMEAAIERWIGLRVGTDSRRVMDGVKARWQRGRSRVGNAQIRGFIGVRVISP